MMFAKRPKRGEDDDDLLRFQEEYLKSQSANSGNKPAAKVARATRDTPTTTKESVIKTDKFSLIDLKQSSYDDESKPSMSSNIPGLCYEKFSSLSQFQVGFPIRLIHKD